MDDQHEIVGRLKELAADLGRTPTRGEAEAKIKGFRRIVERGFAGSYSVALQAAGLPTYEDRRSGRRIDNSVFERDIEEHLAAYSPPDKEGREPYTRTLFLGDVHAPFADMRLLERIYRFAEKEKPDAIVQVGDLYDFISAAKFPRSHNIFTPRDEQHQARKQAETMWAELRRAAPKAKCHQAWGNHDVRPLKRILEVFPSGEDWISEMLTKMMTFDGVETQPNFREELMMPGNVMVHHGYRSRLGEHRDHSLHNFVCGHTHVGGVVFRQIRGQVLWELNAGLIGDANAKGLSYTAQKTVPWTPGWGWLDEYGPRFIPA